jgi:hypothetical protein
MLRLRVARMLEQRCFLLFLAMLALLIATPFLGGTAHGRIIVNLCNVIVLVAAVAAVGRSTLSFVIDDRSIERLDATVGNCLLI